MVNAWAFCELSVEEYVKLDYSLNQSVREIPDFAEIVFVSGICGTRPCCFCWDNFHSLLFFSWWCMYVMIYGIYAGALFISHMNFYCMVPQIFLVFYHFSHDFNWYSTPMMTFTFCFVSVTVPFVSYANQNLICVCNHVNFTKWLGLTSKRWYGGYILEANHVEGAWKNGLAHENFLFFPSVLFSLY